jgi:hypothetical protein
LSHVGASNALKRQGFGCESYALISRRVTAKVRLFFWGQPKPAAERLCVAPPLRNGKLYAPNVHALALGNFPHNGPLAAAGLVGQTNINRGLGRNLCGSMRADLRCTQTARPCPQCSGGVRPVSDPYSLVISQRSDTTGARGLKRCGDLSCVFARPALAARRIRGHDFNNPGNPYCV